MEAGQKIHQVQHIMSSVGLENPSYECNYGILPTMILCNQMNCMYLVYSDIQNACLCMNVMSVVFCVLPSFPFHFCFHRGLPREAPEVSEMNL